MIQEISDYLFQIFDVSTFVAAISLCLIAFAYWLVRVMTDSILLSVMYTPVMLLGGLAANDFFNKHFIVVIAQDSDSNTVLNIAVGMVIAMVVMLVLTRVAYAVSEAKARARRTPTAAELN